MSSEAQVAADRSNATHSTGPKTAEGKQRAAANSVKHGLSSRTLIVAPEDRGEFDTLSTGLERELEPAGILESEMFGEILHAMWTQRRIDKAEAALAEMSPDGIDPLQDAEALKKLSLYSLYRSRAQRARDRALKQLRDLQDERRLREAAPPPGEPLNPATTRACIAMVRRQLKAYERTQFSLSRPAAASGQNRRETPTITV